MNTLQLSHSQLTIDLTQRLPAPSHPLATSYAVVGQDNLVAYAVPMNVPLRWPLLDKLVGVPMTGLCKITAIDVALIPDAFNPDNKVRHHIVVSEKPTGTKIADGINWQLPPLDPSVIMLKFLRPMMKLMRELNDLQLTVRGFSPENIYCSDPANPTFTLADIVIGAPASQQPVFFETLENCTAHPYGRGAGKNSDDVYATAMLAYCLMMGQQGMIEQKPEAIILHKLNHGSQACLPNFEELPPLWRDFFNATLNDNPEERWTLDDMQRWLDKQTYRKPLPDSRKRALRPLLIGETECLTLSAVAYNLSLNSSKIRELIKSRALDNWVRRSLNDSIMADQILNLCDMIRMDQVSMNPESETIVSKICARLDKTLPPRYKGIGFYPEGLAGLLSSHLTDAPMRQIFIEISQNTVISYWQKLHKEASNETPTLSVYDKLGVWLNQRAPGFGIERCLYELDPHQPCRSDLCQAALVRDLPALYRTLESNASVMPRNLKSLDRHFFAFLASRCLGLVEDHHLQAIDLSQERGGSSEMILHILGLAQRGRNAPACPKLAAWAVHCGDGLLTQYKQPARRARLRQAALAVAEKGYIDEVLRTLGNTTELRRDREEFNQATTVAMQIRQDIKNTERLLAPDDTVIQTAGERVAVFIAGIITLVIAGVLTFNEVVAWLS